MSISTELQLGVLTITLDRASARNALTVDMFRTLAETLAQAADDGAVRVVRLKGGETVFSAGADLTESQTHPEEMAAATEECFASLRAFPKPVVAAVCGPAVGEAFTMLLYCDLVYADDKALFSVPAVALARTPRFGTCALMASAAGAPAATEKLLLGLPISAAEAQAMRLICAAVPSEDLEQRAAAAVARLAVLPPQALIATKRQLVEARDRIVLPALLSDEAIYRRQCATEEAQEALSAFLEGRKPVFHRDN